MRFVAPSGTPPSPPAKSILTYITIPPYLDSQSSSLFETLSRRLHAR
jgi:hypothetical protein